MFQGLDLHSGNNLHGSSKTELDDLFCVTRETSRPNSVTQSQEPAKGSVTDLFDPLCNGANPAGQHVTHLGVTSTSGPGKECYNTNTKSGTYSPLLTSYENNLITLPVNSSNTKTAKPGFTGLTGFTGSVDGPVNYASGAQTFGNLHDLSRNSPMQPRVTQPRNAVPMANPYSFNFPNTSHPIVQPSVLSGGSTIPIRLPPPSQRTDFSFVGKSGKADAFSFVQDEMKAKK